MVTIINSTLLYTQKIVERVDLKCYHHTHVKGNYGGEEVLANLIVAIISLYIWISNHHVVQFQPTQCYMSVISQ